MALVVEDGTGVAGANSYSTVAEFKEYHKDRGTDISGLGGVADIEKLLIQATDYITQRWDPVFMGSKESSDQPLAFPRKYLYDFNGDLVVGIPSKLKWAQAEYALRAASGSLFTEPTTQASGQVATLIREKIGPIETETRFAEGSTQQVVKSIPMGDRWLQEYVVPGGRAVRA